jgi:hypothetical protein
MKTRSFRAALPLTLCVSLLSPVPALAYSEHNGPRRGGHGQHGPGQHGPLGEVRARLDLNHHGTITRAEADSAQRPNRLTCPQRLLPKLTQTTISV